MTRNPAATTPVGLSAGGLPIGLQVIGRHHDEPGVMGVVAALEQIMGFDQLAPLH